MKLFEPLAVSSKFALCGLPIRVDTYKNCSFGCKYCFANNREIMKFAQEFQNGNVKSVQRRLHRIFDKKDYNSTNFLDNLISQRITWHCGGMSDPFQPIESVHHVTKNLIDVTNKYDIHILFSTKSDSTYDANIRPDIHTFQLSITNVENRTDIEPNVPDIERRYSMFRLLKQEGFKVGIRIQPFIPGVTSLDILEMFHDADNFTIEGLKLVPQNKEHKEYLMELLSLNGNDFTQMGLLNMKVDKRLEMYKPFIDYLEKYKLNYSVADNDLHHLGTNYCCCGDKLVKKFTLINNTALCHMYGFEYDKKQVDEQIYKSGIRDCKCNNLFTSNRQEGCVSVQDFYDKRFNRKSSPFSPKFLYTGGQSNAYNYRTSKDEMVSQ